jgi:hypothetical protein
MIRLLHTLFGWRRAEIGGSSVWSYWENSVTGERKAYRESAPVWSPPRWDWLEKGRGWVIVDVRGVTRGEGEAA